MLRLSTPTKTDHDSMSLFSFRYTKENWPSSKGKQISCSLLSISSCSHSGRNLGLSRDYYSSLYFWTPNFRYFCNEVNTSDEHFCACKTPQYSFQTDQKHINSSPENLSACRITSLKKLFRSYLSKAYYCYDKIQQPKASW